MTDARPKDQRFDAATTVVHQVIEREGYRMTYCTRKGIGALSLKSRRELRILCNPDSPYALSPVGAHGVDAERLRERIVDALVTAGLLQ